MPETKHYCAELTAELLPGSEKELAAFTIWFRASSAIHRRLDGRTGVDGLVSSRRNAGLAAHHDRSGNPACHSSSTPRVQECARIRNPHLSSIIKEETIYVQEQVVSGSIVFHV
jgi:hypothetical protein